MERQRRAFSRHPDVASCAPAWTWLAAITVGIMAVLAYANSLGNGFVWDDQIIVERQLVAFRSVGAVLVHPRGIPQFSPDYYRPLTVASYLLDHAVGGNDPFAYHVSVVLTHVVVAVLVCLFGGHLMGRSAAGVFGAFTAGALFAVHPIHTESVAWAAGRSDVLASCFVVAALLVHGRAPWSWARTAATGALAAAALGAKEIGVALYPLLLLHDGLAVPSRLPRRLVDWLRGYAGPLTAAAIYAMLRRATLGELMGSAPGEVVYRSLGELVGAIGVYVTRLAWPVELNAYIDAIPTGPRVLGLTALLIVATGAAVLWWWRRDERVPVFLCVWGALTLLPSLAILWKIPEAPIAERYLYLPSVGFCLLVGYVTMRVWHVWPTAVPRAVVAGGVVAMLVGGTAGTMVRNRVWRDDVSLWEDTAHKCRSSGMAFRSLGTAYQRQGRMGAARRAFEQALQRRNNARGLQIVHNNLGTLAMREEDFARARIQYERALQANPRAPDTLFNLGLAILYGGGQTRTAARDAMAYLQRARELSPHDPDIEAALGQAHSIAGDRVRAVRHLRRAMDRGLESSAAARVRELLATIESAGQNDPRASRD